MVVDCPDRGVVLHGRNAGDAGGGALSQPATPNTGGERGGDNASNDGVSGVKRSFP